MNWYGLYVVLIILGVLCLGGMIEKRAKSRKRRHEHTLIRQGRREALEWQQSEWPLPTEAFTTSHGTPTEPVVPITLGSNGEILDGHQRLHHGVRVLTQAEIVAVKKAAVGEL